MTFQEHDRRASGDYTHDKSKGTRSVMKWLLAFLGAVILGAIVFSYALAPLFYADEPSKLSPVTTPATKP